MFRTLLLAVLLLIAAGCSKTDPAPVTPATPDATNNPTPAPDGASTPASGTPAVPAN